MFYFLFLSQPVEFPSVPEKEFTPFVEILFEDNTNTLCCQICPGVVAVVRFVVRFQADVSGTVDEPFRFRPCVPTLITASQRLKRLTVVSA